MFANKFNTTLIIQGPVNLKSDDYVNDHTLNWVRTLPVAFKQFDKVILSSYADDTLTTDDVKKRLADIFRSFFPDHKTLHFLQHQFVSDNFQIFLNAAPPPSSDDCYNYLNPDTTFYYACYTTFHGINKCTNPFFIKVRTDECYQNYQPMIDAFNSNPHKFVCGNIFYKPLHASEGARPTPGHIGDHVFMGWTNTFHKVYSALVSLYLKESLELLQVPIKMQTWWMMDKRYNKEPTPEKILWKTWLWYMNIPSELWYEKDSKGEYPIAQTIEVVDINDMGFYIARWGHADMTFTSEGNPFIHKKYIR